MIVKLILLTFMIMMNSCAPFYLGVKDYEDFNPNLQSNMLGDEIKVFEDAMRTNSKNGEYEWWYFDAKLNDGSVVVAYFWTLTALKDIFFIGVNYNKYDGTEYKKIKYFNKKDILISKKQFDVKYGKNIFKGDLSKYSIKINPEDFDGFGFDIELDSKIPSYRPQDGIVNAGNDYFAWLAAVPNGKVNGTLYFGGKENSIEGEGYHDHNWGNTPLQRLFDDWLWFRGTVGEYTIIGFELNTTSKRGGYSIPGIFVADQTGIIYQNYGQNGIFTSKENLIANIYKKNNESLFSKLKIITKDDYYLEIEGYEVIENLELFEINNIPLIPSLFRLSSIDPHYTRFKSNVLLELPNGEEISGDGVLEIMDLK